MNPRSILRSICQLTEEELDKQPDGYLAKMQQGARTTSLGSFTGSKKELATRVSEILETKHIAEMSEELKHILTVVKAMRFSVAQGVALSSGN